MTTKVCLSQDPLLPSTVAALRKKIEGLVGHASDDFVTLKNRVDEAIRRGTRALRLAYVRGSASTDFSQGDNLLNSPYKNLGFNTVVICDQSPSTAPKSDDEVAIALDQARKYYNANVILSICHVGYSDSDFVEHVKDRFARWMAADQGEIVGVFFLSDDVLIDGASAAAQKSWRDAIRTVSTDVPVFGMIGDVALTATRDDIANLFSPYAFDHLLVLSYPYNLTNSPREGADILSALAAVYTSGALNNVTDPDPETTLKLYLTAQYALLDSLFFHLLLPGQKIIPVVEAFKYTGATGGQYVLAPDILTAVETLNALAKQYSNDDDWNAMTYFHWNEPVTSPEGIAQHSEWWDTIKVANTELQRAACIATRDGVLARYVLGVK